VRYLWTANLSLPFSSAVRELFRASRMAAIARQLHRFAGVVAILAAKLGVASHVTVAGGVGALLILSHVLVLSSTNTAFY
jgi:hypothetical protein